MKTIPLLSLADQYKGLARELRKAAVRVLDSGTYILGPEGKLFEGEFAKALGVKEAVGLSSGTDALSLGLKALGVNPGDEVVIPAFTFIATATAVSAIGAKPVVADVDPETLTLGAAQIEPVLSPRVKAVIPVHLYGQAADMDPIMSLGRKNGLGVLEDCAQAHLTTYKGRMAGTLGHIAAFSFYPSKNLGALGDAGAVTTQDPALAEATRELRNAGRPAGASYRHIRVGHNCRLDELQAALLRVKLKRLKAWTARRRAIAAFYNKELRGLPLRLPGLGSGGDRPSFHLYTLRSETRDALAAHLKESGVSSGVYYPIPVHLQPAYRDLGRKEGSFPVSEQACREVLSLPLYPELSDAQARQVCKAVRAFYR